MNLSSLQISDTTCARIPSTFTEPKLVSVRESRAAEFTEKESKEGTPKRSRPYCSKKQKETCVSGNDAKREIKPGSNKTQPLNKDLPKSSL